MSHYPGIYQIVKRIPAGKVATYGQVAALAGMPRHARQVGYALAALSDDKIPWHRVVNAKGEISRRADPGGDDYQRILLQAEGVEFDALGRIDLRIYQWRPNPRSKT